MKRKSKYKDSGLTGFLKYLRNEMTGKERNAFEKELQKDPFAEEAAEGFPSTDPGTVAEDMKSLQKRLKRRTGKRSFVTLYRIAASVAVLLVISSVFIILNRRSSKIIEAPETFQPALEIAKAEPYVKEARPETSKNIQLQAEKSVTKAPPVSVKEEFRVDTIKAIAEAQKQDEAETVSRRKSIMDTGLRTAVAHSQAIISGKVISAEDNMPVPGAIITLKGTQKSVLTDSEGNFTLPVGEEKTVTLVASFIGMITQQVETSPGSDTEISLQPDVASLSEVVVVGYGTSKKADIEEEAEYVAPEPVGGRKAFNSYIEKNIIRPDSLTAGQRVVVVSGFKIGADGRPDSIRIIRSPENSFSDEAIRLIKEGPAWIPAKRNGVPIDEEVRIRIVFR